MRLEWGRRSRYIRGPQATWQPVGRDCQATSRKVGVASLLPFRARVLYDRNSRAFYRTDNAIKNHWNSTMKRKVENEGYLSGPIPKYIFDRLGSLARHPVLPMWSPQVILLSCCLISVSWIDFLNRTSIQIWLASFMCMLSQALQAIRPIKNPLLFCHRNTIIVR